MDMKEIRADVVQVEADMAYIARRAEIAAANLRAAAADLGGKAHEPRWHLTETAASIGLIVSSAKSAGRSLAAAREKFLPPDGVPVASVAAKEGGAE